MVGFVILHYQDVDMTQKCIESLQTLLHYDEVDIVIVDNGSPNKSGIELKKKYANSKITVIISEENLGFAKGNNLGYQFCRDKGCDCIVVMNNDVIITQENFISELIMLIQNNSEMYSIIAPDVLNLNNNHCNPMAFPPITAKSMNDIWWNSFIRYILYSIPILNIVLAIRQKKSSAFISEDKVGWEEKNINILPHGCCVIFTPEWVKREEFAFVPITFMYAEEHILYEYCHSKQYVICYEPLLQVNHWEAVTTNPKESNLFKTIRIRRRYLWWHMQAVSKYKVFKKDLDY